MPYSYDEETIREVRESNDIVEIISQYIELKKAGSNYKGLCPFHSEKTPSMVVSPDKQMFRCFGCGEGGDVISFLSKYKNMDFKEVIVELAERANIELKQKTELEIEKDRKKALIYEINREAAIFFYKNLSKFKKPCEYLIKRGIDRNTVRKFGIGYAQASWNALLTYLTARGYQIADIELAGLIVQNRQKSSYYDRFRDRVIFPIWDVNSRVIGFGGRLLEQSENQPKYLNSPDTPVFLKGNNIYALNLIKDSLRGKRVVLTEGYMDVVSLSQNGVDNVIASLGTALTREQVKLIKRYTEDIVLAYDSDFAGIKAMEKAIDVIRVEKLTPRIVELEEGLDPDDYVKKYGSKSLQSKIDNAIHYMEFMINLNKKKHDLTALEGKLGFTRAMANSLKSIESPVELELYLDKISAEIGISKDVIKRELAGNVKKFSNAYPAKKAFEIQKPLSLSPDRKNPVKSTELKFLKLAIENADLTLDLEVKLTEADFEDELNREIASQLFGASLNYESLSEDLKSRIVEISKLNLNLEDNQKAKAISDYAKKLRFQSLRHRKKAISYEIGRLEGRFENDQALKEKFKDLCEELTKLDKEMKLY